MAGSVSEYRGLGLNGGAYINDTATHTGNWFAIQATEDTVLATQASNITNLDDICTGEDGTTLSANTVLYGNFTSVDLTSGAVIAYNI
jgi:hypothetical protein|tara:strand:+ start:13 stop:276 length:264 start_codon:yes stop_codon:yes gene_type:complete